MTIEDSPSGVVLDGRVFHNGTTDNHEVSLSFLLLAQLQNRIMSMQKRGVLKVTDAEDPHH